MDDSISRTAAIDALIEGFKRSPTIAIRAKDMIEQLPSAPERKTGKWITQQFGSWAECSECHEFYDIPIAQSNFCPNCGSYNGGEQDE